MAVPVIKRVALLYCIHCWVEGASQIEIHKPVGDSRGFFFRTVAYASYDVPWFVKWMEFAYTTH
jgi:hypothetical protein